MNFKKLWLAAILGMIAYMLGSYLGWNQTAKEHNLPSSSILSK